MGVYSILVVDCESELCKKKPCHHHHPTWLTMVNKLRVFGHKSMSADVLFYTTIAPPRKICHMLHGCGSSVLRAKHLHPGCVSCVIFFFVFPIFLGQTISLCDDYEDGPMNTNNIQSVGQMCC